MKNNKKYTLNFHSIFNDEISYHHDPIYSLHQDKLEELLKHIHVNSCNINLSFDDGHLSDYQLVLPMLKQLELPAIFFVIGKSIQDDIAKRTQTKLIYDQGFLIGSHGYNHVDLRKLDDKTLDYELKFSKGLIEEIIQAKIDSFSLPMGLYDTRVIEKIKSIGYNKIYTTDGFSSYEEDLFQHRINVKRNTNLFFLMKALNQKNDLFQLILNSKLQLKFILKKLFV
jgi:peptidoglycan/xylan/chitin deacetylase (PgdA/CDA1 family)